MEKNDLNKLLEASLRYRKIALVITSLTVFVSLWYGIQTHTINTLLVLQVLMYIIVMYGVYKNRLVAIVGLIVITTLATGSKLFILNKILVVPIVLWYLIVWNLYKSIIANKIIKNK